MEANWIGILVSAVLSMVIGVIWYSPKVFGKEWAELTKISHVDTQDKGQMYLCAFVNALVKSWVLAMVIDYASAFDMISGAVIGFWMWLGFVATTQFAGILWQRNPWKLFYINTGCMLVSFVIMGGAIGILS